MSGRVAGKAEIQTNSAQRLEMSLSLATYLSSDQLTLTLHHSLDSVFVSESRLVKQQLSKRWKDEKEQKKNESASVHDKDLLSTDN